MTRERAKYLAPIISAYADGKDIEMLYNGKWAIIDSPNFNASDAQYRISINKPPRPKVFYITFDKWDKPISVSTVYEEGYDHTIKVQEIE